MTRPSFFTHFAALIVALIVIAALVSRAIHRTDKSDAFLAAHCKAVSAPGMEAPTAADAITYLCDDHTVHVR